MHATHHEGGRGVITFLEQRMAQIPRGGVPRSARRCGGIRQESGIGGTLSTDFRQPWRRVGRSGRRAARVAVVTGAGSGIGRGMRGGSGPATASRGGRSWGAGKVRCGAAAIEPRVCDVADARQTHAVLAALTEAFGRIDVLVNAAGLVRSPGSGRWPRTTLDAPRSGEPQGQPSTPSARRCPGCGATAVSSSNNQFDAGPETDRGCGGIRGGTKGAGRRPDPGPRGRARPGRHPGQRRRPQPRAAATSGSPPAWTRPATTPCSRPAAATTLWAASASRPTWRPWWRFLASPRGRLDDRRPSSRWTEALPVGTRPEPSPTIFASASSSALTFGS